MAGSDNLRPSNGPSPEMMANVLLYGTSAARRHLAGELIGRQESTVLDLLVATVGSSEPWRLRARCLEVLGLVAGSADRPTAEEILRSLCQGHPPVVP